MRKNSDDSNADYLFDFLISATLCGRGKVHVGW